ncbi:Os03g0120350, partial [Oryza sativa Japonica Group]
MKQWQSAKVCSPPFTIKFMKWNTFCVVHPYSGTLHSILINWTSATNETAPYSVARAWKERSCHIGELFTSFHQSGATAAAVEAAMAAPTTTTTTSSPIRGAPEA